MPGIAIKQVVRETLLAENVPFADACRISERINAEVEKADWVETDTGRTFELTFNPVRVADQALTI